MVYDPTYNIDPFVTCSFLLSDGPCAINQCENQGVCKVKTMSLFTCDCVPGWTDKLCSKEDSSDPIDNFGIIIAICIVGAAIVIFTIVALIICTCKTDKKMPKQNYDDGEGTMIAKTWTVSYANNNFPAGENAHHNNFTGQPAFYNTDDQYN